MFKIPNDIYIKVHKGTAGGRTSSSFQQLIDYVYFFVSPPHLWDFTGRNVGLEGGPSCENNGIFVTTDIKRRNGFSDQSTARASRIRAQFRYQTRDTTMHIRYGIMHGRVREQGLASHYTQHCKYEQGD